MLLKDKKVCANCANEYQEIKNLGYDHYEPHRCKENNGKECSDVYNTTCYKFIHAEIDKEEQDLEDFYEECLGL